MMKEESILSEAQGDSVHSTESVREGELLQFEACFVPSVQEDLEEEQEEEEQTQKEKEGIGIDVIPRVVKNQLCQNSTENRRKLKTSRASKKQLEFLITYMEQHLMFAFRRCAGFNGKQRHASQWEKLAETLNSMQGAEKSRTQWQIVWRDMKANAYRKAQAIKKDNLTSGSSSIRMDEMEKRVLSLHRTSENTSQIVEDSSLCSITIPDSEEEVELSTVDHSVELTVPLKHKKVDQMLSNELDELPEVFERNEVLTHSPRKRKNTCAGCTTSSLQENKDTPRQTPTSRNTSFGIYTKKLNSQLDYARDQFASIASNQAQAMEDLGKAMNRLADVSEKQTEVLNELSRTVANQQEVLKTIQAQQVLLNKLVDSQNKIIDLIMTNKSN